MRKSTNMGGQPIFLFTIEMPVSKFIFAKAIAGYYHESGGKLNPSSTKTDVLNILKKGLMLNGVEGINTEHWDGASMEFVADFQNAYDAAIEWIERNYPYLSK